MDHKFVRSAAAVAGAPRDSAAEATTADIQADGNGLAALAVDASAGIKLVGASKDKRPYPELRCCRNTSNGMNDDWRCCDAR